MCKRKSIMAIVVVIAAVAILSWSYIGVQAGAPCCPSKAKAVAAPEKPDAPSCCGTCGKAASCPMAKKGVAKACCPKAGTAQCCAADTCKSAKGKRSPALQKIHACQLPKALEAIDAALKALETGDQAAAVRHITAARLNIQTAHLALAKCAKPTFVNTVCPMMGSPIKPEKVTANLTREHKGRKVGFCCPGCPVAWDKLTDAQKEEKLTKAKAKPVTLTEQKTKP